MATKYLTIGSLRIGAYDDARSWYALTPTLSAPRAAAYYDRSIRSWVVFIVDEYGQQDGDAQYTKYRSCIRNVQRTLTRWD